jgi:hypothetical protein
MGVIPILQVVKITQMNRSLTYNIIMLIIYTNLGDTIFGIGKSKAFTI